MLDDAMKNFEPYAGFWAGVGDRRNAPGFLVGEWGRVIDALERTSRSRLSDWRSHAASAEVHSTERG
jgi:hypothetical protein